MQNKPSLIDETFALAVQNHKKNNFKISEDLYKKILKKKPNHFESIFLLGSLFVQIKNFDEAKKFLNNAIKLKPNHADAHNNLGVVYGELEEYKKAKHSYQEAIKINPVHADAYNNLGNIFKVLEEFNEAGNCYEKAIKINPGHIDAYNNLATIFKENGKYLKALRCYEKVISIDKNNTRSINNLCTILRKPELNSNPEIDKNHLKKLLLLIFKRNDIGHRDMFLTAKLLLKFEENEITKLINSNSSLLQNKFIQNLLGDELFLLMLQKCLNVNLLLEKFLTKLRSEIIITLFNKKNHLLKNNFDFIVSLAEQCFLNEYVYIHSKKENENINRLINKIENDKEINELEVAILGCYMHLHSSKSIKNKLLNYKSKNILFDDLIAMQIREPLREKELTVSIKTLTKVTDEVSKKVKDQYEKYPYPRWRYAYKNMPQNFLFHLNSRIKPNKITIKNKKKFSKPDVLVAGCGTGNHICLVENYLNANIVGVDLSIASLAYAKRKAEELNFKNIEFFQADILQLENFNRKFDIIECVGVLHHMDDPLKGMKILLNLLQPDGFLKVGLYSEIARSDIVKAREFIKKNDFKNTLEDIRSCRQMIMDENKDLILKKIPNRFDFYSTSSVRDLIFHVKEHRFKLSQILKILKNLNLEFLGFNEPHNNKKFNINYKNNVSLSEWDLLEKNYPDSFGGMYNFWVRKKNN